MFEASLSYSLCIQDPQALYSNQEPNLLEKMIANVQNFDFALFCSTRYSPYIKNIKAFKNNP